MIKCDFNCFECVFPDCIFDSDSSTEYLDEAISLETDSFLRPQIISQKADSIIFSDIPISRYKRYYWEHRDSVLNRAKKYYQEHKEERKAYRRAYYEKNREIYCLKQKEYYYRKKEIDSLKLEEYYQQIKERVFSEYKSFYKKWD